MSISLTKQRLGSINPHLKSKALKPMRITSYNLSLYTPLSSPLLPFTTSPPFRLLPSFPMISLFIIIYFYLPPSLFLINHPLAMIHSILSAFFTVFYCFWHSSLLIILFNSDCESVNILLLLPFCGSPVLFLKEVLLCRN